MKLTSVVLDVPENDVGAWVRIERRDALVGDRLHPEGIVSTRSAGAEGG